MRILTVGAGVIGTVYGAHLATSDPRLAELERALRQRGFTVQRVKDMDGWLA